MRRFGFAVLILLLALQPAAALVLFLLGSHSFSYLVFLPSFLWAVVSLAYRRWDWAYLQIERLRIRILGRGVAWGATAEYSVVELNPVAFRNLLDRLRSDHSGRILTSGDDRTVMVIGEVTLVATATYAIPTGVNLEDVAPSVTLEFVRHEWPYARITDMLNGLVPAVFDQAYRALNPTSEKYHAEIRFTDGNPYFGFFLRNVQLASVDRFVVELSVTMPGDPKPARVTATKDHMTIVASRVTSLTSASRRYIAISGA